MSNAELEKKIAKQIKMINNERGICLFCSQSESYHKVNGIILKELTNKYKFTGIYVTLNKEHSFLEKNLKKGGTDVSKLYFIDGTSKNNEKNNTNNCTFISSPQSLTELSLAISAVTESGKFAFLFLDSISTLLVYNDLKTVEKFTNYLINKIRNLKIVGIIITLDDEGESKKLNTIISQFCDAYIKL